MLLDFIVVTPCVHFLPLCFKGVVLIVTEIFCLCFMLLTGVVTEQWNFYQSGGRIFTLVINYSKMHGNFCLVL